MTSFSGSFEHAINSNRWGIRAVRALSDNFMYLIIDRENRVCAAVDAVEPEKIVEAAKEEECTISHVLTTHSHWDHDGGNAKISKLLSSKVPIIGGVGDGVKAVTKEVADGDEIYVGNICVRAISTPFHTPGHICYFVDHDDNRVVLTGDTLFIGGCGNLNTGTKEQLHKAFRKLGELPKDTMVFCGHEYTVSNLTYATSVEPDNERLKAKKLWAEAKRNAQQDTIPSTIEEEFETSPFMKAAFGMSQNISAISGIPVENSVDQILWVRKDKSSSAWKKRIRL